MLGSAEGRTKIEAWKQDWKADGKAKFSPIQYKKSLHEPREKKPKMHFVICDKSNKWEMKTKKKLKRNRALYQKNVIYVRERERKRERYENVRGNFVVVVFVVVGMNGNGMNELSIMKTLTNIKIMYNLCFDYFFIIFFFCFLLVFLHHNIKTVRIFFSCGLDSAD